ncbi:Stk1 family PASTA domain-containing Ser/Thr kinase [Leifsonia sp. Root112D2]|uniref:Stk1 family PASTA domain-containing Ser/Thr kinase n=1 Tax=Leifsonia sp. Root112D2 TaxID=1736426 RepID=UPI000A3FFE62|nr:Stk1 family PASTA domain-containing Ser/Thr kinase [Leifsonia sp. Root112D2]
MTEESRLLAGRYLIGELLGRGGMSDVHRGTDTRLGRTVAIKLLKPSLAIDPAFRTRFRQEAQAAARMAHPTIVRVFDAGEETIREPSGREAQLPFIVMEYVDGRLLKDIIKEGPVESTEAVRITEGILTALEYSHRAGVVHRDIKPGNVMITKTGQVKVMDFGIARAIGDSSATVAQTTAILGTASYFSPEQAKGESVDARTDLYSTGVVLFEMLTGRAPFRGDTAVAVAYQHVSEKPAIPSTINPRVSPALDLVVEHALAKDRSQRYQNAAEFRDELEAAGAGRIPVHTKPDSFADTLFNPPTGVISSPEAALRQLTDDDTMVRTQRRPPVVWIWAGIAVVAVIIVAVLFWVFSQSPSESLPDASRRVPAVAGQNYDAAVAALKKVNLEAARVDEPSADTKEGVVTRTDPKAGDVMTRGDTVTVYVSTGKKTGAVPDTTNMSTSDAEKAITDAGFTVGEINKQDSPTIVADTVLSSDPAANSTAHLGDTINLNVSNGMVTLPDVTKQSLPAATALLQDPKTQLTANPVPDKSCPSEGTPMVTAQSLPPGEVPQGSTIDLTYCSG